MQTSSSLTQSQLAVLSTVQSFSQAQRYLGLMPRHVVISLQENDVELLESQGLVEWGQADNALGATIKGIRLTDQGRAVIQTEDSVAA